MFPISPRSARQQFATIDLLLRIGVVGDRIVNLGVSPNALVLIEAVALDGRQYGS